MYIESRGDDLGGSTAGFGFVSRLDVLKSRGCDLAWPVTV